MIYSESYTNQLQKETIANLLKELRRASKQLSRLEKENNLLRMMIADELANETLE